MSIVFTPQPLVEVIAKNACKDSLLDLGESALSSEFSSNPLGQALPL